MQTIVTLTLNPSVDLNMTVDQVIPERKLRCTTPLRNPGGGGINVSRAIHRLGGTSLALYLAGGMTGDLLADMLDQEGITNLALRIEGMTRESFSVIEESTGQQFRFSAPGPTVSQSEWQSILDVLRSVRPSPDYIVASGGPPPGAPDDIYAQVAGIVKELDARLIVDTHGEPLRATLEKNVYLIKPNLREFAALVGNQVRDEEGIVAFASQIVERGASQVVIISLGAAGALLVSEQGSEMVRAPTVPINSKVGAGDSMVAGIVLGLIRDHELRDAVRFGVAAGAATVMTPGTELCRRADTERLFESMRAEEKILVGA